MKNIFYLVAILVIGLSWPSRGQDLVSGEYSREQLKEKLVPHEDWNPFPKLADREGWSKADQKMMQSYLKKANTLLDYDWPAIPATKSLLIDRTGDRDQYQAVSFNKREVLGTMLLAEIYENEGRFIDPIINGVWSICEESFWGVPAHLPKTKEYSGLMDVSRPFVDLFAAETATFLAWVDYFLGEKLDEVSPQIRKRIYYETNNRIFEPLMNQHHGWMSANANGRPPNNWNPWICSNWINTALILEKDDSKRTDLVYKAIDVLDEFLNPYPEDGGCDEGPSYWGAAAASLYDNISFLNLASNDAFRYVFEDEKVKNMGKFIYRAQISDTYFLNFADADPQPKMSANMIYRYGKDIQDPDMMRFGAYYRDPENGQIGRFHYFRNLFAVFIQDEFQNAEQGLPLPKDVWLPDIQVMVARDQEGSTNGFFLAAKGGHNDESHNHNDIGNYVVYYDGMPLLIDVGRGTYTRKTFSEDRYDIWYNRSDYHNIPTINEQTQQPGAQFKASNVTYDQKKNFSGMSLDIAKAYPEEAGINSWNRSLRLNRGKNVTVTDELDLNINQEITQHLMTVYPSEILKPGQLLIHYTDKEDKPKDFVVQYDPTVMEAKIEKVQLDAPEDRGIIQKWGDRICRINFNVISPKAKGKMDFEIRKK
jgi:hypothetical protein